MAGSKMNKNTTFVGIAGIGYDIPADRMTSEHMAEMSGIPVTVLTEKIGMHRKSVADADDHPTQMAIRAARRSLEAARMDASEVDIVIFCGGSPQDFGLGFPAATIQAALGVTKSQAFELRNSCNGANLALHTCKSLLLADPTLQTGLVVCAEKWSTILDYSDPQNLPLFILADGAAAAVVSKYVTSNRLLAYEGMTDGRFAEHIIVKQGGTRHPVGPSGPLAFLRAESHDDYASLLETVYLSNYAQVIQRAVEKSGCKMADIRFAILNQNFEKLILAILENMGLTRDHTWWSLTENGHLGSVDVLYCLAKALEAGRIEPGNRVVLASSALGFTWAASVLHFL
jgi:3-oxoacyl-[acyl-carrier-protein] synthase-3